MTQDRTANSTVKPWHRALRKVGRAFGGTRARPEADKASAPPVVRGTRPVFHLELIGGLANRMIEYMIALHVQSRVPGCIISNVSIPEWNIHHDAVELTGTVKRLPDRMRLDLDEICRELNEGSVDCVVYSWYGQNIANFHDAPFYRGCFQHANEPAGYSDDYLVINIRGAEILDGRHEGYTLIPIQFYRDIIDKTKLKPVFFGQIADNIYMRALRAAFPDADYQESRGALADFAILRQSANVVPAVSTFSWLACWLSEGNIFFPVVGLYNPFQEREHDLLPLSHPNVAFFLFPILYGIDVAHVAAGHAAIDSLWCEVTADMLRTMKNQTPRFARDKATYLACFDPAFYLERYPDIRLHFVTEERATSHYETHGYDEKREPLRVDKNWYVKAYPLAAQEIGRGDFETAVDHYLMVGQRRGYRPVDPSIAVEARSE